jgi:lysyl-tRNA synthetase class 2
MLELYRAGTDYQGIMQDLEGAIDACARALCGGTRVRAGGRDLDLAAPFERLAVGDAFARIGVDLAACDGDAAALRRRLAARGLDAGAPGDTYDDLFFRTFLAQVEPALPAGRPVYVVDWPAPMAALARLKPADPRWAERFELYAGGLELANGFSELTDAAEQRRRLEAEKALRERLGRPSYPIDERFLAALPRMPASGGVALGLDRLLMLLTGAAALDDVLLFPARDFLP